MDKIRNEKIKNRKKKNENIEKNWKKFEKSRKS